MQDKEIIELFWNRDESAITETEKKYGSYCHRIAMNILNNEEDVKECLSDIWLKVWNEIPRKKPHYFQGFLAKITRNTAIDQWKRRTAAKRGNGTAALVLDELEECVSGSLGVEEAYEGKELSNAIDVFVRNLPKKEQRIFIWRYFYMESVQDIAKMLYMKENHVSVILSRTRDKLKRFLQKEGYEL